MRDVDPTDATGKCGLLPYLIAIVMYVVGLLTLVPALLWIFLGVALMAAFFDIFIGLLRLL